MCKFKGPNIVRFCIAGQLPPIRGQHGQPDGGGVRGPRERPGGQSRCGGVSHGAHARQAEAAARRQVRALKGFTGTMFLGNATSDLTSRVPKVHTASSKGYRSLHQRQEVYLWTLQLHPVLPWLRCSAQSWSRRSLTLRDMV